MQILPIGAQSELVLFLAIIMDGMRFPFYFFFVLFAALLLLLLPWKHLIYFRYRF